MSALDGHAARLAVSLSDAERAAVVRDPITAIADIWGIDVQPTTPAVARGDGGHCDGMSLLKDKVLHYRPTPGRRQNFTLTHELAHFLLDRDDAARDWLMAQPETGKLTERLCDAIASRLLIPDVVIKMAGATPSGALLLELHDRTCASDQVAAIRLAERLPCAGFVALIDASEGVVDFASRRDGTQPYAWEGDALPDGHPLSRLSEGQSTTVESWWPYRNGAHARYYVSASRRDDRIYAVFAEEDLWNAVAFHVPRESHEDTRPELTVRCECGYARTIHDYPCAECGKPFCPECQACGCTRRAKKEQMCKGCTVMVARHLLDSEGLCEGCR